jgi:hypothetical protein
MKINKISIIKSVRTQLLLSIFGVSAMIIFGTIFFPKGFYVIIFLIILFYSFTIFQLFWLNDFYSLNKNIEIISITKRHRFENNGIKFLYLDADRYGYRLYIGAKKFYINISSENKKRLIEYFKGLEIPQKENVLKTLNSRTILY